MPHINVKLWPGKSEDQKQKLAEAIVEQAKLILGSSDASLSVAFEEIPQAQWTEKVVKPEIRGKPSTIYRKPGYAIDG